MNKIINWFKSLSTAKIVTWWKDLKFWQKAMIVLGGLLTVISLTALAASA